MAREYGRKQSRSAFGLRVELRYLIMAVAVGLAFMIPRVVHDRIMVGLAECGLWLSFIGWVAFGRRQTR